MKKQKRKIRQKTSSAVKRLSSETRKQTTTALVAAFAFLIALVWKEVIINYTNSIVAFFSIPGSQNFALLYTALLTTIIAVIGIILVNLWGKKEEN